MMKKTLSLILTAVLILSCASGIKVHAKSETDKKIKVPEFSVEATGDGLSFTVTVKKTGKADGYEIYYVGPGPMYENYGYDYYGDGKIIIDSKEYRTFDALATLKEDGQDEESITLTPLIKGTYDISVRAYKEDGKGNKKYSFGAPIKQVTLSKTQLGSKKKYDLKDLKAGDVFEFGVYEQDDDLTNGKEPLEWLVLYKTKSRILVITKKVIDNMEFSDTGTIFSGYQYGRQGKYGIRWDICSLRRWLNESFYEAAFNEGEKKYIENTLIYGTESGKATWNKVFLLSHEENLCPDFYPHTDFERTEYNKKSRWFEHTVDKDSYWERFDATSWSYELPKNPVSGFDNHWFAGVRPSLYLKLK